MTNSLLRKMVGRATLFRFPSQNAILLSRRLTTFTTTYQWIFDPKIPSSEEARRALALYRDGRNAEQNFMVSYAVLNFFRIIEIRNHARGDAKDWFRDNFAKLRYEPRYADAFNRFAEICANEKPTNTYTSLPGCCLSCGQGFKI
jgi:hypothetical protein